MGRPISGMQIVPFAGLVPPEPGLALSVGETYYSGSIGGATQAEIAGLLVANVDVKASFTLISLLYVWRTPTKNWNFASVVGFPRAWLHAEASLSLGPFAVRKKDDIFGLFDLVFTPIIASHHFNQTDHLAFDFHSLGAHGLIPIGKIGQSEPEQLDVHSWSSLYEDSSCAEH